MAYLYLALAILFEVLGSSFIKASDGFTKWIPTLVVIVTYVIAFYFLSLCLKTIPLSIAYAIWSGVGIVLTVLISVYIFKQKIDLPAIIGIVFILIGVIIINYFSKATQ
ncbi:multidrug efflux SMR transporter [Flavobacterium agricola]|uniref:Multidrug efflux SMR transporter n=1 Tax=Flavobacterium agricola TaxID=2870839 RepID=A0ABY6M0T5_9FLAO|nr:multidrug efflux SMR transporter [Flavobacterium agricola]UYW00488.1 multidrug efflux SMR transporter [Flavobacterium agricola]